MAGRPRIRAMKEEAKKNKYCNKSVVVDGIRFDSIKEGKRYVVLKDALDNGIITGLVVQPSYEVIPRVTHIEYIQLKTKVKEKEVIDQRPTVYYADFQYMKDGKLVVEDVKISKSLIPKEFVIKKKLMLWRYGISVRLVFQPTEPI